jgi:hypothetical protein
LLWVDLKAMISTFFPSHDWHDISCEGKCVGVFCIFTYVIIKSHRMGGGNQYEGLSDRVHAASYLLLLIVIIKLHTMIIDEELSARI